MQQKLDAAYDRGVLNERARVLWLMDDERQWLRNKLNDVILVESQRHAMQVKIKLVASIYEQLKMRMMTGEQPPPKEKPDDETEISLDEGEGA